MKNWPTQALVCLKFDIEGHPDRSLQNVKLGPWASDSGADWAGVVDWKVRYTLLLATYNADLYTRNIHNPSSVSSRSRSKAALLSSRRLAVLPNAGSLGYEVIRANGTMSVSVQIRILRAGHAVYDHYDPIGYHTSR